MHIYIYIYTYVYIYICTYVYVALSSVLELLKPELGWLNLSMPGQILVPELTSFIRVIIIIIIIITIIRMNSIIIIIIIISVIIRNMWDQFGFLSLHSSCKSRTTLRTSPCVFQGSLSPIQWCHASTATSQEDFTPRKFIFGDFHQPSKRARSIYCFCNLTWTLTSHPTPHPIVCSSKTGDAPICTCVNVYIHVYIYIYVYI